jgi:hypothetical protein
VLQDKFERLPMRDQAGFETAIEKTANAFPAFLAVVQGPVVDIHANKFVGQIPAHVSGKLKRVLYRRRPMVEAEFDAGGQNF